MHVGLPRDPAPCLALLAAAAVLLAPRRWRAAAVAWPHSAKCLALLASLLSWGYVVAYLRGGPRIIDATSYFLEARLIAEGRFSFALSDPAAATMGRFLVRSGADAARAGVIFPPGYPAVLAVGHVLGAPLAV